MEQISPNNPEESKTVNGSYVVLIIFAAAIAAAGIISWLAFA